MAEEKNPKGSTGLAYRDAAHRLVSEFAWNSWFINSYWPENEPRVRRIAQLCLKGAPPGRQVLELGCANGYIAALFHWLGFEVEAADAYPDVRRTELFQTLGIDYHEMNLNEVSPLRKLSSMSFDMVLLGEVFEHILNQPKGLLEEIFRVLRPGGTFILTTPNPSTVINAFRLLQDRYVLWGTPEFLRVAKIDGDKIIDRGDIHYREYPARIIRDLLAEVGFEIGEIEYIRYGNAPTHSFPKRLIKGLLLVSGLSRLRLFAPGYLICTKKPDSPHTSNSTAAHSSS